MVIFGWGRCPGEGKCPTYRGARGGGDDGGPGLIARSVTATRIDLATTAGVSN